MKKLTIILSSVIIILSLCIVAFFILKPVPLEEGNLRITPVDFFSGDAKILEKHLNWHADSFKVYYEGERKLLGVTKEIWEDGKVKSTGTSSFSITPNDEILFSFSMKKLLDNSYEYIVDFEGDCTSKTTTYLEIPKVELNLYTERLEDIIIIDGSNPTAVWGYFWNTDYYGGSSDIMDYAKNATGGVVLKLSLVTPDDLK